MSAPPGGAKSEDSRRGRAFRAGFPALAPLPAALLFAGLAGGLLLVAAELSTVVQVSVGGVVSDRLSGADQHSYAVGLLGLIALPLSVAAVVVPSRPAALALAGVGLIALAIVLVGDLPDVRRTGLNGALQPAVATAGTGFWLEIAGGAVLLAAGAETFRAAGRWRR